jgi:CO dehydrogenase maturation factor
LKFAVTGKGGAGKSSLSLLLGKRFLARGFRVLLVDADPDGNLSDLMGIPPESVTPIVEMKELIRERTGGDPDGVSSYIRLNPRVDDIPDAYAVERDGMKLVTMGTVTVGGSGCVCPSNSFIRQLLRHMVLERDEVVIMDMEAGIEHLGRATADRVDCLLVVTEPNRTGLTTTARITKLSEDLGIPSRLLIGNKVRDEADREFIGKIARDGEVVYVPWSPVILEMSRTPGEGNLQLEPDVGNALGAIIAKLELLQKKKETV